ncbi:hypothetical protein SSX86_017491 [Deinandra increscens subsp. villosa]|uniref:NB-ARC domain-containing protein n=1 Tax=Deinandra increscens subsp. villosa TaxID=3103831 RepID=A0AAP0CZZ8_9ASTR
MKFLQVTCTSLYKNESKCIKEIVDIISQRLYPFISSASANLIGVEARVKDLKSKLQVGLGGVLMIGIWGVGGGGKTTLASSVYDEVCGSFHKCCFVENIREESSKNGLKRLKEKVISVGVKRVGDGRCKIKSGKVLIVLDDVDHLDQLNALAGSHDWFGEGSRIIITTRDKHLLNAHRVNVIHHISLLDDDEAMKLFFKHAPRGSIDDYETLSKDVVSYASGLPLALKVLGCFLCDKNLKEWRSALARLKKIPENDIVEKLRISYDGLISMEKDVFLDIACFLRGEKKEKAMEILDACKLEPVICIKVLLQKALITILDGKFHMHDLIQEMGHYIVRGKHFKNPEKHSRVWQVEDVTSICAMDATDATTYLPNLKMIKLHDMKNLVMTPDFDGLPNLERFILNRCPRLEKIHSSIEHLQSLAFLLITGCDNLKMVPSIKGIKKLDTLSLSSCNKLSNSWKQDASHKHYSTNFFVTCLPCCWGNLDGDPEDVEYYLEQPFLLYKDMNHRGLQLNSVGLRKLFLSNCHLGDGDIDFDGWKLLNLEELDLSRNLFSQLNFSLLQLARLKWLDVSSCNNLRELSDLPSSIAVLRADYCYKLETVGDISSCKWLWKVSFLGKNKLGHVGDKMLLSSMCQFGQAIEYHVLSLALEHEVRMFYVSSLVPRSSFILRLPDNWYNDFCGFLIYCVIEYQEPYVTITIEEVLDNVEECNYSNELFVHHHNPTYIGYVSFSLLSKTTRLNRTCNMISFELGGKFDVELVPRKS